MRPIKLLIADVEGTLVTQDKLLTLRACEAVDRLRGAGIQLALTSGRPPRGMAMLVEPLGLIAPIAAFNGGVFVTPDPTTVLEQRTLPLAVGREVVGYLVGSGSAGSACSSTNRAKVDVVSRHNGVRSRIVDDLSRSRHPPSVKCFDSSGRGRRTDLGVPLPPGTRS
jgi:hydroxymethylpyrimidine pyrophosphatase-like HAD family hydrolase